MGAAVTTGRLLAIAWEWEPSIVVGCALLLAGYVAVTRLRWPLRAALFALGVVVLLLTLVGPLDFLGDDYLFSAHMVEHLILVLVVPPLLIAGLPRDPVERLLRWAPAAACERCLRRPVVAWILGVGTMWAWHAPPLYNAALADERIHIIEHLTMLVTGTIFFWPLLAPTVGSRIAHGAALAYVFTAAAANMLLGILLTFSTPGAYPHYLRSSDGTGIFILIRKGWGLDGAADLQLGGLAMWVLGSLVFLGLLMMVYARWYIADAPDTETSS